MAGTRAWPQPVAPPWCRCSAGLQLVITRPHRSLQGQQADQWQTKWVHTVLFAYTHQSISMAWACAACALGDCCRCRRSACRGFGSDGLAEPACLFRDLFPTCPVV